MAPRADVAQEIRNFYTWGSFLSLSVAAGAVWTVAGALSHAFEWEYPRYFPLLLALLFSIAGDFAVKSRDPYPKRMLLWVLNGCLIYTTALGATEIAPSTSSRQKEQLEAQATELSEALRQTSSTETSPELRSLEDKVARFTRCLAIDDAKDCASTYPVDTTPSLASPLMRPLKSAVQQFTDSLRLARGEIGFRRISEVWH